MFSYIGAFSGTIRNLDAKTSYDGVFADPAAFSKRVRVLWFGVCREAFLMWAWRRESCAHKTILHQNVIFYDPVVLD